MYLYGIWTRWPREPSAFTDLKYTMFVQFGIHRIIMHGKKVKQNMQIDRNTAIYVGVDVHRYEHTAVAANRFEEELGSLSFTNTPDGAKQFLDWIAALGDRNKTRIIGIEGANGNGKLLYSHISPVYQGIYEINPVRTKQRREHGTKGDKSDSIDAKLIIEVLTRKLEELPKVTLQDQTAAIEEMEQLIAFHNDLTRTQTRLKNQLHQLFHRADSTYQSRGKTSFSRKALTYWYRQATRKLYQASEKNTVQYLVIKEKIKQFRQTQKVIKKIDKQIKQLVLEKHQNLPTLPGIGITTAATIIVETKGIDRFRNIDTFVKYAGIAPVERQSGKTKKHRQAKGGNRQLNKAIYFVALTQLRCLTEAQKYYGKKIKEGKTKKQAIRCLMKRVACIVYGMLKSGEEYRG